MAGTPYMRKNPEDRNHKAKVVYDDIPVCWDNQVRGPRLPADYEWCERTREWWEMIRHSAQAMAFLPTDWEYLLETALIHNRLWGNHIPLKSTEMTSLAAELRIRLERYGFTWADRRKYGIKVVNPETVVNEAEVWRNDVSKNPIDYREMWKD